MRRLLLLLSVLLTTGTALAQGEDTAHIRFAHFSVDAPDVIFTLDGTPVTDDISFPTLAEWQEVPAGTVDIGMLAGDDALLSPQPLEVAVDGWYTVTVIGQTRRDTLALQVVQENFGPLDIRETRLTVFHAIPDASSVNIVADDTLLIGGLGYPGRLGDNDGASTLTLQRGTYDLMITTAMDSEDILVDLPSAEFAANRHYFIAAVGLQENATFVLAATPIETIDTTPEEATDEPVEEDTAAAAPEVTGHLRIGHFAEPAPTVDVYINGDLAEIGGVEFPSMSAWTTLPVGTHTLTVVPTGEAIESALLAPVEIEVTEDSWQSLILIAADGEIEVQVFVEDYSPMLEAESRLTLLHALPGAGPVDLLVNDQIFAAEIGFGGTRTFTLAADFTDLLVTPVGDIDTALLDLFDEELIGGRHTFVALTGTGETGYYLQVINQIELTGAL